MLSNQKTLTIFGTKLSLSEQAYQRLEEAIVTLELAPGLVVSEQSLSEMTQIGRTPIREAIQRLARENLITVLPQRGILVAEMDVQQQLKLIETRREIERLICRSAARRATPVEREQFARLAGEFSAEAGQGDGALFMRSDREFNELCLKAARNEFAEGAMRLMHGLSRRFFYHNYQGSADLPLIARQHAQVARYISEGNADAAASASDTMLDYIEAFTRATLDS
ncbi:GntR family transcriptional regulator [Paenalcaligenes niemegkensis]|uniref:GntR family transcriptional regulator n=1 Tax=Paenalcaligenes niemegkensis TaxID=2895469 RepID=UPI001EE97AA8|nr:GntR family transcriptional regulator [Paenalcaligenes niemegkensis]MCQ9618192.1 GntR family transcriptional regulator [Paenalcaligenes niemegkensis]